MFSPLQNVKSHTLPNGLQILLKEDHAWPLVSVQAWVRVGSVDETRAQAGISHVIEHMVFKGTEHFQAAAISRWVEALGGAINAETAKEYTHYYIDVPRSGAAKAVILLGELLHRARFDPSEWARECPVILEEIKRRNDDPETLLWDLLNQAVFREERLYRPVIGSPDTIATLDRDELWAFYKEMYTAKRSLIVVTGDFKSRQMLGWIRSAFDDMPAGDRHSRHLAEEPSYRPQHLAMKKPVHQTYAGFGFPTPPADHPDHEALDLLATILGEGRGSRLVRSLRENKKLVWSISAANISQEGPGIFSIFAECPPSRRKQVGAAVENMVTGLRRRLPVAGELVRAKNLIQTSWLQNFETYHHQASTLGLFALDNHLERFRTYLPKINALNRRHLEQVLDRYFLSHPLSSALVEA